MHLARIRFLTYSSILELEEICAGFGRETIIFHIVESTVCFFTLTPLQKMFSTWNPEISLRDNKISLSVAQLQRMF